MIMTEIIQLKVGFIVIHLGKIKDEANYRNWVKAEVLEYYDSMSLEGILKEKERL